MQIAQEVDELLSEIDRERRLALLESVPFGSALTKEHCLRWFSATGIPPAGALRGVYCWAADRDYNYDSALITGETLNSQTHDAMSS